MVQLLRLAINIESGHNTDTPAVVALFEARLVAQTLVCEPVQRRSLKITD